MPELPEVQSVVDHLAKVLKNRLFVSAKVFSPKSVSPSFAKAIRNQRIKGVQRRAKMIVIKLSGGNFLVVHLKMTGQLIFVSQRGQVAGGGHPITSPDFDLGKPSKFTRVILNLDQGGKLLFHDVRKFGWLKIVNQSNLDTLDQKHGVEPLEKKFTLDYLKKIITQRRKSKIKQLLMNQELIAGIGNIYADESLFAARIKPTRTAGSLKPAEISKLYLAIKKLLKQAIRLGGTSVNTFVQADGGRGNYSGKLKVYGRGNQLCFSCQRPLKKIRLNGRGTVYCLWCQK